VYRSGYTFPGIPACPEGDIRKYGAYSPKSQAGIHVVLSACQLNNPDLMEDVVEPGDGKCISSVLS
jgi:hypothetical protein